MRRNDHAIKVPASPEMFQWIRETATRDAISPGMVVYQVLEAAMKDGSKPGPVSKPRHGSAGRHDA